MKRHNGRPDGRRVDPARAARAGSQMNFPRVQSPEGALARETATIKCVIQRCLPQLRCEFCRKPFPKISKRPQRSCSVRCRKALSRERAAFEGVQVTRSQVSRYALKTSDKSESCNGEARDPRPARFNVPLDILGRGHDWLGGPKLDRATWDKIVWREIGPAR
jgi:hypothetical protein